MANAIHFNVNEKEAYIGYETTEIPWGDENQTPRMSIMVATEFEKTQNIELGDE